ncbi:NlpC/P60 family protein [Kitasatospora sp. NPDC101176]|uniref:NlpC/P60 family protein n=1 Tax=Kitasatospora sp. NPDC101176 TaxID=3364099 RepID=UPI0038118B78
MTATATAIRSHRRPRQRTTVRRVGVLGVGTLLPLLGVAQAHAAPTGSSHSANEDAGTDAGADAGSGSGSGSDAGSGSGSGQQGTQSPAPVSYQVKAGDTLSGIASQHGLTWQQVYDEAHNRAVIGPNPHRIFTGQKLDMPAGGQQQPVQVQPASDVSGSELGTGKAQQAVAFAKNQLGKPYIWGAVGPSSFDCSGLVQAAFRNAQVQLGRTTYDQVEDGTKVGQTSPKNIGSLSLKSGDLVFFGSPSAPHHVGIYIGTENGVPMMIHAPKTGDVVKKSAISIQPDSTVTVVRVV